MNKSLIIACSPRKNGNSDIMAQAIFNTMLAKELHPELIYLRDLKFSPCIGCNACYKDGKCIQKDDLQEIYPKLLKVDYIVFSAPIYFQSLGAMAKAFVDRCQCFWSTKYILKKQVIEEEVLRTRRKTYAVLCGGTNFPDTFTCTEKTLKLFGLVMEAKYAGGTFFPLVDEKGDILKDDNNIELIKKNITNLIDIQR